MQKYQSDIVPLHNVLQVTLEVIYLKLTLTYYLQGSSYEHVDHHGDFNFNT